MTIAKIHSVDFGRMEKSSDIAFAWVIQGKTRIAGGHRKVAVTRSNAPGLLGGKHPTRSLPLYLIRAVEYKNAEETEVLLHLRNQNREKKINSIRVAEILSLKVINQMSGALRNQGITSQLYVAKTKPPNQNTIQS